MMLPLTCKCQRISSYKDPSMHSGIITKYIIRFPSFPVQTMKLAPSSSTSLPCYCILFALLLLLHVQSIQALIKLPPNVTVPAVIAFGDSIVDPGNNNHLTSIVKCNFAPYGRDFMGGKPTGRFSNGKIPTDILVEELGIKEFLPAYLDPSLKPADLLTGVSFASGASGYDPLTPTIVNVIKLSDQLNYFKEYIEKLKAIVGEEGAKSIITDTFYLVVAGSDDIANTYFDTPTRRLQYNVDAYTDLMINGASSFIQELYNMGARRIGVFNVPPIGCLPSQRTIGGGLQRQCASKYNEAAGIFNSKLSSTLDMLNANFKNAKAVYIDVYNPLLSLITNPTASGYEVVDKGCCGTGNIEVAILCNQLSPSTCSDPSKYLFWDSYHPTQKGYEDLLYPLIPKYLRTLVCIGIPC